MQLNQLQPKTKRRAGKRVGRGRGSGKGKTAGRGTKGQKARAGHKIFPQVREQIKKLPKLRGYRFASIARKAVVVNVGALDVAFAPGDTVTPALLAERRLIRLPAGKQARSARVKILGTGELAKKLSIAGCEVSASARAKIEKAGGAIVA